MLASASCGDVSIAFVDGSGDERCGLLADLWSVRFETTGPVRRFPSHKGQTNFQGAWWLATTGDHVGFESWLERDHVMLLDFDPLVAAVSSQPFWLSWTAGGKMRRHCPDYFVRLIDGTGVVVDVRADDRIEPGDAEAFAVTARACESVGWQFRRAGVVDPVVAANLRWLAGYRHRRFFNAAHAPGLRAAAAMGRPLGETADAVGDRVAVLPSLYHLMWSGVIGADLHGGPLTAATTLRLSAVAA